MYTSNRLGIWLAVLAVLATTAGMAAEPCGDCDGQRVQERAAGRGRIEPAGVWACNGTAAEER